jgi:hypothetical protein
MHLKALAYETATVSPGLVPSIVNKVSVVSEFSSPVARCNKREPLRLP